jgi:hypothetical protein
MLTFDAPIWVAEGTGTWHFVSLPPDCTAEVRNVADTSRPGFGSLRVQASIGATIWRTSIFPDAGRGTYVLPVKKSVRQAEQIGVGDVVSVGIVLLDSSTPDGAG